MKIRHQVLPTGHYIIIHEDNIELSIRTEHGTESELAAEAQEMRKKAARLTRNADMIKKALHEIGI